jgi:hypothetical protein
MMPKRSSKRGKPQSGRRTVAEPLPLTRKDFEGALRKVARKITPSASDPQSDTRTTPRHSDTTP